MESPEPESESLDEMTLTTSPAKAGILDGAFSLSGEVQLTHIHEAQRERIYTGS